MDQSTVPRFVITLTDGVAAGKSAATLRFEAPRACTGPVSLLPVALLPSPFSALVGGSLIPLYKHDHQPLCHSGRSLLLARSGLLLAISY